MRQKLWMKYFGVKDKVTSFMRDERGETNMIAIILIILVVIGLAALFKDRITEIVGKMFDSIDTNFDGDELSSYSPS